MAKTPKTIEQIKKAAIGLLDNRSTDNDGLLVKRDQKVTMLDIFGTEQKTAVAYYVSDLLGKGFNNQQIITAIEKKYDLRWSIRQVNVVKELLRKMWRCEIAHTMNDQIAREVSSIDVQLKEAWEAWEFSKKGIKNTKKRNTNQNSPSDEMTFSLEEIITEENTCAGDVKFLQHINDLGKEKRKLLGLYAPEKKTDDGPKTALQFNIVGEGAGGEITSLMASIMQGAQPQVQQPIQKEVEEVQYVSVENSAKEESTEAFIERMYNEVIDEENGW